MSMIYHKPGPRPKKKRIKKEGKDRFLLREALSVRSYQRCETCDRYAPLLDGNGDFDMILCGHTSHFFHSAGAGGDDTIENCKYECWYCHDGKHRGDKRCK